MNNAFETKQCLKSHNKEIFQRNVTSCLEHMYFEEKLLLVIFKQSSTFWYLYTPISIFFQIVPPIKNCTKIVTPNMKLHQNCTP